MVCFLSQIFFSGNSAWYYRLQKYLFVRLDERDHVGITSNPHNINTLIRILLTVWVRDNIEKRSMRHGGQHFLKRHAPFQF